MQMKRNKPRFLISLSLLLIAGTAFSQYGTKRFNYHFELEKRLYPRIDTIITKEIVLFCAEPSFKTPEQSIRIIETGNQFFIEARILEKNLLDELHRINPNESLSIDTHFISSPVSETFKNRMLDAFSKLIVYQRSTIKPKKITKTTIEYRNGKKITIEEKEGPDFFDGTSYFFRTNENGVSTETKISCPLDANDFRNLVSTTNLQIIKDLMNNSFNESKYAVFN